MSNDHPITPPPELVRQWIDNDEFPFVTGTRELLSITKDRLISVANQAARWGADQELEACLEWVCLETTAFAAHLQAARRPKPPSLKEQAIIELSNLVDDLRRHGLGYSDDTIRRALEQHDD